MRKTLVRPKGLATQPNKYALEPGHMSRALNVCMRDPDVVTSLPGVRLYRLNISSNNYTIRRLWPAASSVLSIEDDAGTWAAHWVSGGGSSVVASYPTGFTLAPSTAKTQLATVRDRFFLAANDDTLVFDSEGDTSARYAGLLAPRIRHNAITSTTTNAVVVATTRSVAYCAIISRKQSDGYELRSPPSNAVIVTNTNASTVDITVEIIFPNAGLVGIEAGDVIELYRTKSAATADATGTTFYLSQAKTLAAGDIVAGFVSIRDISVDDSLKQELYSNQGQPELLREPEVPPPGAQDIAVFKGFTFYSNTRVPSFLKYRIPGALGTLNTAAERTNGIGQRGTTGDITSGSPTMLNVADTTGLVIGQRIQAVGVPGLTTITNIVGTTVTMSANATATTVGVSVAFHDVLEVNGVSSAAADVLSDSNEALVTFARTPIVDETGAPVTGTATFTGVDVLIQNMRVSSGTLTFRATNGANYSPAAPEISAAVANGSDDARGNRYHWSKDQQPEAVPILWYAYVGKGSIYRMVPTEDSMLMFCSDGLYKLTGDAGQWRTDPVDPTLILAARNAVDVIDKVVWAYTNEGLVAIAGDAIQYVSRGRVGDPANLPGATYADTWDTFLTCDELHHEAWLTFRSGATSTSYVYNTLTDRFVTVVDPAGGWSTTAYSRALRSLVMGAVSTNPDVLYFELDTSTTRMGGADVRFQPIEVDDAFTRKQFVSIDWLFEGATTALTLVPVFSGTNYTAATIPASTRESRKQIGVPRNAPASAPMLEPGFTLSAGGTSNLWSFRGMSIRWNPASEESSKR